MEFAYSDRCKDYLKRVRDFMDAYVAFRGRKPTLDALLRQSGIGKAA